jgi:hypothetical protein
MSKKQRRGGFLGKVGDWLLGEQLPEAGTVLRSQTNVSNISSQYDEVELSESLVRHGKLVKTVGELKDADQKTYLDSLKGQTMD